MKIGIANDHRGYNLKNELVKYLKSRGYEVIDYGSDTVYSVDYPDFAFKLCNGVVNKEVDFGIAICGSGIGISIACNKVNGIRCAKLSNVKEAYATRFDNDANVMAINGDMPRYRAKDIVDKFLSTDFSNFTCITVPPVKSIPKFKPWKHMDIIPAIITKQERM